MNRKVRHIAHINILLMIFSALCFFMANHARATEEPARTEPDQIVQIAELQHLKIPNNLVGKNFADALMELNTQGIPYRVRQKLTCEDDSKETVLKIERGAQDGTVRVIVTVGRSGAKAPDIFGTMIDEARNTLRSEGFENIEVSGDGLFVTGLSVEQGACLPKNTAIILLTESGEIKPEGTPDCETTTHRRLISRFNVKGIQITEHESDAENLGPKISQETLRPIPGYRLARTFKANPTSSYFYAVFLRNQTGSRDAVIRVYCSSDLSEISEHKDTVDGISYGHAEEPGEVFIIQTDQNRFLLWNIEKNHWSTLYTPEPVISFAIGLGEDDLRIVFLSTSGDVFTQDLGIGGMWRTLFSLQGNLGRSTKIVDLGRLILILAPEKGYQYAVNTQKVEPLYDGVRPAFISSKEFYSTDGYSSGFLFFTRETSSAAEQGMAKTKATFHLRRQLKDQSDLLADKLDVTEFVGSEEFTNAAVFIFPQSNVFIDFRAVIVENEKQSARLQCLTIRKNFSGDSWSITKRKSDKKFSDRILFDKIQTWKNEGKHFLLYDDEGIKSNLSLDEIC